MLVLFETFFGPSEIDMAAINHISITTSMKTALELLRFFTPMFAKSADIGAFVSSLGVCQVANFFSCLEQKDCEVAF